MRMKSLGSLLLASLPTLGSVIVGNPLVFDCGVVLLIIALLLITLYFQTRVWGLGITFSRDWSAVLGNARMHRNPVIRTGSNEGCIIEFELKHGIKINSWNLRFKVSKAVVIDNFGPQGRSGSKLSYHPSLGKLGNCSAFCVHGPAGNHQRIPASVHLELDDMHHPTGTHVMLEIFAGYNLDLNKCKRCKADECKQSSWKMKDLEKIEILVIPSC